MFQLLVLCLSFLFISCGEKEKIISHSISNVQLDSSLEENQKYIILTADVGAPGLVFNGDLLGVYDPLSNFQLGSLLVLNGDGAKNKILLKIKIEDLKVANSLEENALPNLSAFPVQDYDSIIVLPAGQNSRLYLMKKNDSYTLGLAIVIPEFDQLIHQITPSQIIFNLEGQSGVGGFFTAKEKNKSGMLIFKPLDSNRRKWITKSLNDKKLEVLFRQVQQWQKKKTKFRVK